MNTSETILAGVNKLANTVKQTLGTKGRTILFNDENNRTHITKDGVTVARHIMSEDNYENLVITVLREASLKTMKSSGDGPQPLWAKVLTPNGFTTMGDIKVGDKITGTGNTVQEVIGVYDKGVRNIYKVHFNNDRIVECCEDHLWTVKLDNHYHKYKSDNIATMTTWQIMNNMSNDDYYTPSMNYQEDGNFIDKIIKIEPTDIKTEMKCIKVSNPDSLYITDNFIVTHNTTTTMILAQYLITEGLKLLSEGVSFYELSKQIDHAVKDIVDYINNNSIKIEDNPELLREIAAISSNDEKLGDFIYSIVEDIGLYGDIEVKESQYSETRIHKTQGMKLHKGWIETFMVNDVREMSFKADNCHVLIIDDTIQAVTDIDKYIHALKGNPLVVFCDDITDITLKQIEKMIQAVGPNVCFVNNDGHGDRKLLLMNDLAALTSAYVIDAKTPFDPKNMGFAEKIKVDEWYTSIIGGKGDTELIEQLVEEIKDTLSDDENVDETNLTHVERKFHKKRLANLTGGVAVIHVGGKTQMEMKELKDRFDDAVLAVESAIKQGVNVGGGSTYINCQKSLNKVFKEQWGRGYKMVLGSLESPFKQLLINADLFNQFEYFKDSLTKGMALDLRDNKLYKLSEAKYKVYDPSSVLIDSLVNASAVAKSLLSIKDILYDGKKLDK